MVWTDVLQVGVMLGGVGTAIWFMAHGVPSGLGGIINTGTAMGKFHMVDWSWYINTPTVWVFIGMFCGSILRKWRISR